MLLRCWQLKPRLSRDVHVLRCNAIKTELVGVHHYLDVFERTAERFDLLEGRLELVLLRRLLEVIAPVSIAETQKPRRFGFSALGTATAVPAAAVESSCCCESAAEQ